MTENKEYNSSNSCCDGDEHIIKEDESLYAAECESDLDDDSIVHAGGNAVLFSHNEGSGEHSTNEAPSGRWVLGIDETGRGPVLGPMVYCGFLCAPEYQDVLKADGFNDSKQLTPQRREALLAAARRDGHCGWFVRTLSARRLSRDMLREHKINLNEISHAAAIAIVRRALRAGYAVEGLYVDTVGDPGKYRERLVREFPEIPTVVVAAKADGTYPCVGAASVVAKCLRDTMLRTWRFRERPGPSPALPRALDAACRCAERVARAQTPPGEAQAPAKRQRRDTGQPFACSTSFGSGYPADPVTAEWLRESADYVFGYPSLIRFSWKTCSTALEKYACPVHWHGDDGIPQRNPPPLPRTFLFNRFGLELVNDI